MKTYEFFTGFEEEKEKEMIVCDNIRVNDRLILNGTRWTVVGAGSSYIRVENKEGCRHLFSRNELFHLTNEFGFTIEREEQWVEKTGDTCACWKALENGARNAKFGTYRVFINENSDLSFSFGDKSTFTVCAYSTKDAFTWEEKQ